MKQQLRALERDLRSNFPETRISTSTADRVIYSRDMWPRALIAVQAGSPKVFPPHVVVWPETVDEIATAVQVANRHAIPIVAWGGGSGVCGAAVASAGGIILDLKRMNRVEEISHEDLLGTAEAGIIGQHLEERLNLEGLTMGHFPASIYCSTLGGWVATRSAGQMSTRYGNIEEMVEGLEVVTGSGKRMFVDARADAQLFHALVGSEGTLAIICKVIVRLLRLPPRRSFYAYALPTVDHGVEALRRVMQLGLKPSVLRLYDQLDSFLAKTGGDELRGSGDRIKELIKSGLHGVGDNVRRRLLGLALNHAGQVHSIAGALSRRFNSTCRLIVGYEGERSEIEVEASLVHNELIKLGARGIGAEQGEAWYRNRYAVAFKQSPIFSAGAFVDTMEVAATWSNLLQVYNAVCHALSARAIVLAHFSHAYATGCSIYFTFSSSANSTEEAQTLYDELWNKGLAAAHDAGATISHHHGIGLNRAPFMKHEHGEALDLHRSFKCFFDPKNILNRGKLGL